jgi:serine phosphatase RsbU (regulator of sigma subunit)
VLGVVSLSNDADRRLTTEDIDLARQLTTRAAIAIDNARLHAAVSDVARTLQRALLPPALPVIPGLDLAARYLPASQTLEVGGDFYDAFPTSPERWVLAVGDVCGRGIEAATVTGAARHAIRSAATRTSSPAEILATLDEVLCEEAPDRFCTTAVAVVDRTTHGITVTVASAGHPAPLLRRGGVVAEVELAGALLGVAGLDLDRARREVVLELEPGDALLLYTDGLTEARRGTDFFDGGGLADAVLAAGPDAGAEAVVEAVVRAVQRHVGGDIDDDAAALAAVVTG